MKSRVPSALVLAATKGTCTCLCAIVGVAAVIASSPLPVEPAEGEGEGEEGEGEGEGVDDHGALDAPTPVTLPFDEVAVVVADDEDCFSFTVAERDGFSFSARAGGECPAFVRLSLDAGGPSRGSFCDEDLEAVLEPGAYTLCVTGFTQNLGSLNISGTAQGSNVETYTSEAFADVGSNVSAVAIGDNVLLVARSSFEAEGFRTFPLDADGAVNGASTDTQVGFFGDAQSDIVVAGSGAICVATFGVGHVFNAAGVETGSFSDTQLTRAVANDDACGFYAPFDGDFELIDVSDPDAPVELSRTTFVTGASFQVMTADRFIVGHRFSDFSVLSFADPANPVVEGTFELAIDGLAVLPGDRLAMSLSTDVIIVDPATPDVVIDRIAVASPGSIIAAGDALITLQQPLARVIRDGAVVGRFDVSQSCAGGVAVGDHLYLSCFDSVAAFARLP